MKYFIGLVLVSGVFGCSHHHAVEKRLPALDSTKQSKIECVQEFNNTKKQAIEFLAKNRSFGTADKNKKIVAAQDSFQVECVDSISEKNNFQINLEEQKIYFERRLKNSEGLFETPEAKAQVEYLKLELRAITFDMLYGATVLQALHDFANGKDDRLNYYFQYIKTQQ